ncbi:MAG: polysulfide reductase, partial [Thermoplasmata archaeon]|nr:polysulfide reductase [Thermoplasmata archaeon]
MFQVISGGLQVTGMNRPVYWGIFIMSFIYFIGLSHAGTLISAILRVTDASWRRPLTRIAEAITVFVLFIGAGMVIWDVGRPIRALLYLPLHGRFQSPLVWDFAAITTYLTMSISFLYVAMIPDIAHVRDRLKRGRWVYDILALGFQGTKRQWEQYERSMFLLSVAVIPVAVSVHTVVSFIFSMEPKPMWHETIFGPFFVTGALFSGVAAIIVSMFLIRRYYHLEEYLNPRL